MSEYALVAKAQAGDEAATAEIIRRYIGLAIHVTRGFTIRGGDFDDVRQEQMIGIANAIRDYKPACGTTFSSFVALCVQRHFWNAIKLGDRQKHRPLNEARTDPIAGTDGEPIPLLDAFAAHGTDPAEIIESREELRDLVERITKLSVLERDALVRIVFCGEAYGSTNKSLDNALQRARRKLAA